MNKTFTDNFDKAIDSTTRAIYEYPWVAKVLLALVHIIFTILFVVIAWVFDLIFVRGARK